MKTLQCGQCKCMAKCHAGDCGLCAKAGSQTCPCGKVDLLANPCDASTALRTPCLSTSSSYQVHVIWRVPCMQVLARTQGRGALFDDWCDFARCCTPTCPVTRRPRRAEQPVASSCLAASITARRGATQGRARRPAGCWWTRAAPAGRRSAACPAPSPSGAAALSTCPVLS